MRYSRRRKKRIKSAYRNLVHKVAEHLAGRKVPRGRPMTRSLRGFHFFVSGPRGSMTLHFGSPRWVR